MIHDNEYQISLKSVWAYCDICHRTHEPLALTVPDIHIRRSRHTTARFMFGMGYETIEPITISSVSAEVLALGWKNESFHGKEMWVCPACQSANAVQSQPVENAEGSANTKA